MFWLEQLFAGLWPLVWRFGAFYGIAILALVFAWFSPVFKKTALWVALGAFLGGSIYAAGVYTESARRDAQQKVIEHKVDDVVKDATSPEAAKRKDPFDDPNN